MPTTQANDAATLREVEMLDSFTGGQIQGLAEQSQQLAAEFFAYLKTDLDAVLPWFLSQMPPLYHEVTPDYVKREHLMDMVSGQVFAKNESTDRVNTANKVATMIVPGENGLASVTVAPKIGRSNAKFANIFLSLDSRVAVASLYQGLYSSVNNWAAASLNEKKLAVLKNLESKPQAQVNQYLASLDAEYTEYATPRMISLGFEAIQYCQANENAYINLNTVNSGPTENRVRVDIGLKSFPLTSAIESIIGIFNRYNFNVRRVLANEIRLGDNQQFAVLHIIAVAASGEKITPSMTAWGRVLKGLKTLSYVDHGDEFSALLQGKNPMSLNETNLVRAMANWAHIFLTKVNPYYYSLDRVSKSLVRNDVFLVQAISYFRSKFDPRFDRDRSTASIEISRLLEATLTEIQDDIERSVLREAFNFLQNILKTNYFLVSKGALSFRVDPKVLNKAHYPDAPFGIFYMIGKNFRAFQVRYRDIARGGVRVVMPRTAADYDNALAALFDEVNGLASAQQLKNKDIPEGGSKCVFVLRPGGDRHLAVKSAISGLLDLITTDAETGKLANGIIDYYGQEEIIYLGPDENMTNDLIDWTIQHALHRGYKYAYAFMSSKPDFGINHKTYGVTSEGVNVCVDNVLRYLKLNSPNTTFRVKMTGGPDGDVAGNELKILHREYGARCKVVAIGDGFGAAYDPAGLNWTELLRLVQESRSIVEFNPALLSKDPKAFSIKADTKENIKIRDNLYATVEAEIFIPAGGRPYTVKDTNWHKYLNSDGKPSSLAIVEGANIYFTPEARKKLVEHDVIVIKDSSANKGGVICSSYEIIACLTVSPEEFAEMKPVYVSQVIAILRNKADLEAKLLFSEWRKRIHETNLVDLSYEISTEINMAKDIVREYLNNLSDEQLSADKYSSILFMHCPDILVEKFKDRIVSKLPRAHKIAIISAFMASRLIYREGLNWLDTMEPEQVYRTALEYIDAEHVVESMISEISASGLLDKEKIISILKGAGAKHLSSYLAL